MLTSLSIRNFVTIEEVTLDFISGFIVITGETGSGKSLLLDALELLLGARGNADWVAPKAKQAELIAEFSIQPDHAAHSWLNEQALDEDNQISLRRVIQADGRSKAYINGRPANLNQLKSLGLMLLNIHGQHEQQTLLDPESQRQLLDAYLGLAQQAEQVKAAFYDWQSCQQKVSELLARKERSQQEQTLLEYQLQELKALSLTPTLYDEVAEKQKVLANQQEIETGLQEASSRLSDAPGENAQACIHLGKDALTKILPYAPNLKDCVQLLEQAELHLEEAIEFLRQEGDINWEDANSLPEIERTLTQMHDLARKHKVSPQTLFQLQEDIESQLQGTLNIDDEIKALELAVEQLKESYLSVAKTLSTERQNKTPSFNKKLIPLLHQLNMPHADFVAELTPLSKNELSPNGLEKIEFKIMTNPGQPLQPLTQVVSGGELSRICLAIDTITSEQVDTPTLIFDEVDVGVGGQTANTIGQLLKSMSQKHQVLCITHLPQIAALSNQHIYVQKDTSQTKAQSRAKVLTSKEKQTEIARMLGGDVKAKSSLAHAKALLETA